MQLLAGEDILYTGIMYSARDQAHKRLAESVKKGKRTPFPLRDAVIYYTGPTPAHAHHAVGSAGPTTSGRMDVFTPCLLDAGLGGMVGKGGRSKDVIAAIRRTRAVYFLAVGGAGAYLSSRIKKSEVIVYSELGTEAIHRFEVVEFPLIVGIDARGNNVFKNIG